MSDVLAASEMAAFARDGYLAIQSFFSNAELAPVIDELCEVIDRESRALVRAGLLTRAWEEEGFETRLARITEESEDLLLRLHRTHLVGPSFFDLMTHPRLLDLASQLIGPELIASAAYRIRPKAPGHRREVQPWHQDASYNEPWCDEVLIVACWIPLVDATRERGCVEVIPGRHREGVFEHGLRPGDYYLGIKDDALPRSEPVCVPLKKGGLLIFTNTTPHRSLENRGDVVRWSVDFRYQSAELPTNALGADNRPLRERKPDEPIGCFPPAADFLVRSAARPHDTVRSFARFRELRERHRFRPASDRWGLSSSSGVSE